MMFRINLATRDYINRKKLNTALAAAFFFLSGWLMLNIYTVSTNLGEIKNLSEAASKISLRSGGVQKQISQKEYDELLSKIAYANSIIVMKQNNWVSMLDNIEAFVPDNVAITAIDPDPKTENIKLTGITKNFSFIRILLENMEKSKKYSDIFLLSQSEIKVGKDQKGINFSISCKVAR